MSGFSTSHVTPARVSALERRNWRLGMHPCRTPKRQDNKGASYTV